MEASVRFKVYGTEGGCYVAADQAGWIPGVFATVDDARRGLAAANDCTVGEVESDCEVDSLPEHGANVYIGCTSFRLSRSSGKLALWPVEPIAR